LFASAALNHVLACGAFGKSRHELIADAEPSVAEVAVQSCGSKFARIVIVTLLSMIWPHRFAAYWNALRRCCPTVVPGLPPTGVAGVGSLKPSPGPSLFRITICAFASAVAGTAHVIAAASKWMRDIYFTSVAVAAAPWMNASASCCWSWHSVVSEPSALRRAMTACWK
jgi:hypothetical protein